MQSHTLQQARHPMLLLVLHRPPGPIASWMAHPSRLPPAAPGFAKLTSQEFAPPPCIPCSWRTLLALPSAKS